MNFGRAMNRVTIRPLRIEDADDAARIFFEAVHIGTREHYSEDQRRAWGGEAPDPERVRRKLDGMIGFVAEVEGQVQGFMTIDAAGYIDLAFVSPGFSRQGIGHRLYRAVEEKARALGASELTTEASLAARPFFERQGWSLVEEQSLLVRGVSLANFKMRKTLRDRA